MKDIFIIFVLCATYTVAQNEEEEISIYGMQDIKVLCDTKSKYDFVLKHRDLPGYDFLSLSRKFCEPIEVLVDHKVLDSFKQSLTDNDIKYIVSIEDVSEFLKQTETRTKRENNDNFFYKYPQYDEIINFLKELEENNKDVVEYFTIGTSFEGRELMAVKISQSDGKKKRAIVIDAGIHAREWIAPTTALYIINELVEKRNNHNLLKSFDFYVIPLLNPDGYEYSRQSIATRLWRKTRSILPNTKCIGVDANRNFDIAWPTNGTTVSPCAAIYPGERPFSEPETQALRDFLLSKDVKVYISFHSYGNKCMAKKAANSILKKFKTRYSIGTAFEQLYETTGCSHDWALSSANVDSSFVIELPSKITKFAPPNTQIIPIGQEMFEAIKIFSEYSSGIINDCQIM